VVTGLEIFRQYFQDYQNDYILIGGVACELVLNSMHLEFRPTSDFDIVIVSDKLREGFGVKLKNFIHDGGYTVQSRKSNNCPTFFRFVKPKNGNFPAQLELASDKPVENWDYDFAPLDAGDGKPSLSAIIFEAEYYKFICANSGVIHGITTIKLEGLIPLKALAFHELSKIESSSVETEIKIEKHISDIFRLADALSGEQFSLPAKIASNLSDALAAIQQRNITGDQIELLENIRQFYRLKQGK
jgi:hypothetical protein